MDYILSTTLETVTPEKAREYLEHNVHNRSVRTREVAALAREIKRGEYVLTHQGIAFDVDGNLVDGQQRLLSVIMANTPIRILVTRGLSREAMAVIDRGESRSIKDVMEITGDPTAPDAKIRQNSRVISAISQLVRWGLKGAKWIKVTPQDTMRVYDEFKENIEQAYDTLVCKSKNKWVRSVVISAAIAALANGVPVDAVRSFFDVYFRDDISGCEDYNVTACLNWGRMMTDARVNHITLDAYKVYLATQNALYHFANNTGVKRIRAIDNPRYEVAERLISALALTEERSSEEIAAA